MAFPLLFALPELAEVVEAGAGLALPKVVEFITGKLKDAAKSKAKAVAHDALHHLENAVKGGNHPAKAFVNAHPHVNYDRAARLVHATGPKSGRRVIGGGGSQAEKGVGLWKAVLAAHQHR